MRSLVRIRRARDGSVTACTIVQPSGESRVDAEACRILRERAGPVGLDALPSGRVLFLWQPQRAPTLPRERGGPLLVQIGMWLSNDDFPLEAIRAGQGGRVAFGVSVSAEGRATGCAILTSSGSPLLDGHTCALATARMRFIPASDGRGGRAAGTYYGAVVWNL